MNARYSLLMTLTLLLVALVPLTASADVVQWEGNGHYYEYLSPLVTWEEAHIIAENRNVFGSPGYLVTLTSQAENDFVYNMVLGGDAPPPAGDPWIGGYQNSDHSEPAANWHWVTEEGFDWVNWAPGEPNDWDEQYGEMYLQFTPGGGGMWNDHHSLNPKPMIVEYSNDVVANEESSWGAVKSLYR
ncbi:MAG: hypothetical protein GY780_18485 [bacterium]|nr:hypothetical protein [bacterium]